MANSTSSSSKSKADENNSGRCVGQMGPVNSGSSMKDATGPRRSIRETSSKKMTPSPSTIRKSERLGKSSTSLSPLVRRKSSRVEKQKVPSPLRRSKRNKNHSDISSSGSKSSDSLALKQKKKKKHKSVKKLTFEAEKAENEEHKGGTSPVKRKIMDARAYRVMLTKKPKIDCPEEASGKDNFIQEGGNIVEDKIDENIKGSNLDCKEVSNSRMVPSDDAKERSGKDNFIQEGGNNVEDKIGENIKRSNLDCKEVSNSGMVPSDDAKEISGNDNFIQEGGKNVEDKIDENIIMSNLDCVEVSNCGMVPSDDAKELCQGVNLSDVEDRGETEVTFTAEISEKGVDCSPSNDVSKEFPADDGKICLICKCSGRLLFCSGKECGGCYHFSCLKPPMVDAPLGVWHCHLCLKKKIELGVYSVSEGVESIWDAREVKVSYADGWTTEKHFLVKYKGLAHVHNRWVPESQLLLEAPPSLLEKFNQKDQALTWKHEWRIPHRLLQKRALVFSQQDGDLRSGQAFGNSDCHYEWLVKWHGLGYEHASWELDNASFLCSLEGRRLIKNYEDCHQRAKRVPLSSKVDKKLDRNSSLSKLAQTPGGFPPAFGMNNLDAVNKLREHWHKGQNAVVFDDHDRMVKMVAFILSLDSNTRRPFLIISTSAALHLWEDEFSCWAPSLNVIVYSGNQEIRRSIRKLEFYGEGGSLLFQVLIALPEMIIEDLEVLEGIEFEAIIVDECQWSKISTYLKQIKMLKTGLWILLLSGQLKDSVEEYHDILAFLDHQNRNEDNDDLISNSRDIDQLKDKLSSFVAYRCKSDSFRFVEYWVPVNISNVQLEQYCAALLSNSSILRSQSKSHVVGALHDILITTRKCCNHPYLVDESLQSLLIRDLPPAEILDVGIQASGKLQLLDSMLMELKKQGLRVLILFQFLGGSGKVTIGDILDDLIRQRFGPNSYERIDKGVLYSKKQSALKMFNDKDLGRFVFLLETNACHHSIKLSAVDTIIIFDSDWNPLNDIKSLQKITLDSQLEQIKIFRLYSSFTVEERALVLAKQDRPLDSRSDISWSASHTLLMWGASSLFDDLKEFHDCKTDILSVNSLFGELSLKQALHEFSSILKQNSEDNDERNCSFLLKVKQNALRYYPNFYLLGELKFKSLDSEPCHLFWTKVLEGKNPQWKYSCGSSQRSRKRVQLFDGSGNKPDLENEEAVKKRAKLIFTADQPYSKREGEKLSAGNKEGKSGESMERPQGNDVEFLKAKKSRDELRSLHVSLKSEIATLCEILHVPDNVKKMADEFLEYVMNNHHVDITLPKSILEAFQISLCWIAAALLKHKIDHEASFMLAKHHLKFDCGKDEANVIYSMLRCLKNIFLHRTGNYKVTDSPKASASELSRKNYSCTGLALEAELAKKDVLKSIEEIRKKCQKRLRKLLLKHQEERNKLDATYEGKKANLERKYKIELAVTRSCAPNRVMRSENLKDLFIEYMGRIEDLKHQHEIDIKDLENVQLIERQMLQNAEDRWVEDVKSWAEDELLNTLPSKEHGNGIEYLKTSEQAWPDGDPKNRGLVSNPVTEGTNFDSIVEAMTGTGVGSSKTPEILSPLAVQCSNPVEGQTPPVEAASAYEGHDRAQNTCDGQGEMISAHSHSKEHVNGATCMMNEGGHDIFNDGCREKPVPDGSENDITADPPSPRELISDGSPLDVSNRELSSRQCESPLLPDQQTSDGVSLHIHNGQVPNEVPETSHGIAECYNGREHQTDVVLSGQTATSEEQEQMSRTMNNNTLSQALQDSHTSSLTSSRMGQIQNSSGPVEQVSRPVEPVCQQVDVSQPNGLNHESPVGELLQQMLQLPPAESSNSTHDPYNEGYPSAHVPPAPMEVTNQTVHPSSNSELDSLAPVSASRTQSLDMRNVFTPSEINNNLRQTVTQSMNRMHSPLSSDPLKNELDRLRIESEQTTKYYEDVKLQLKSDCEREIEEIRRKYDVKLQERELEFQLKKKNLETNLNLVLMNKMWAEAFRSKCMDLRRSGAPGMQQDPGFAQLLAGLSRQQRDMRPSLVASSASALQHFITAAGSQTMVPPPVSSMQILGPPVPATASSSPMVPPIISATTSSPTMVPPLPAAYNTSGICSNAPPRPPPVSSMQTLGAPMPATASSSPMVPPIISTTTSSQTMAPTLPAAYNASGICSNAPPWPLSVSSMQTLGPPMPTMVSSSPMAPLVSATTGSLTLVPPLPAAYNAPPRPPHINSISPLANHQAGSGFRTTPPHLQPYRPLTSLPDSSHQAPNNIHVMPSLPNRHRPTLPTNISNPHNRVHRPEVPVVLPSPNLSAREPAMDGSRQLAMNLPNTMLYSSNVTSLQQYEFGTASNVRNDSVPPAMSPDVVCLSDDD